MPAIGSVNVKIGASTSGLDKGLKTATTNLSSFKSSLVSMAAGGAAAGLAIAGIGTTFDVMSSALSDAAAMEQSEIAFGVLFKSADTAKAVLADLSKFAAETPFEMPQLVDSARQLAAFGVAATDIVPQLKMLGDIAAGTGQPINEIAEIFGKAKVQGRLFGEDINQLTGRGIPVIGALAKQFNVAESQVKKLVEEGKVGFPELESALASLTSNGGQFEGMMEAQSKSLSGLWSTLKDNMRLLAMESMKGFTELVNIKGILETIIGLTDSMRKFTLAITPVYKQLANIASASMQAIGSFFKYLADASGLSFKNIFENGTSAFTGLRDWAIDILIAIEFSITKFTKLMELGFLDLKLRAVIAYEDVTSALMGRYQKKRPMTPAEANLMAQIAGAQVFLGLGLAEFTKGRKKDLFPESKLPPGSTMPDVTFPGSNIPDVTDTGVSTSKVSSVGAKPLARVLERGTSDTATAVLEAAQGTRDKWEREALDVSKQSEKTLKRILEKLARQAARLPLQLVAGDAT